METVKPLSAKEKAKELFDRMGYDKASKFALNSATLFSMQLTPYSTTDFDDLSDMD